MLPKNHVMFRDRSSFFFIHIYKNMGTTLHSQFSKAYNKRFYGWKTIKDWEKENLKKIQVSHNYVNPFSIDHIRIDELVRLGILDMHDIRYRKFVSIVREPIERFISMCNFKQLDPDQMITQLKTTLKHLTQCDSLKTKYIIDLTLILMEEKELIKSWFLDHGINLDLDIVRNSSEKIVTDLTPSQLAEVKEIFSDDIQLYERLKSNLGIQKLKGFKYVSVS